MKMSKTAGAAKARRNSTLMATAAIVLVVVIVIMASVFGGGGGAGGLVTHSVSAAEEQAMLDTLAGSGNRVAAAFPETEWGSGESGSFSLGVKNNDDAEEKTLYLNVYLESMIGVPLSVGEFSDDVGSWLTYPATLSIPAGETLAVHIEVRPDADAPAGAFILRAALCQSSIDTDCRHTPPDISISVYSSMQLPFEIVGA